MLLAGVQLLFFTERTATHFAWTIQPPLTAAFLGSAYWAAAAFEWSAARARTWADARIAVPAVFVFTVLTLIATLLHLDKFHLGSSFGLGTQFVTWAWIAIYAVVPILMVVLWLRQRTAPGVDPPRTHPYPMWLRVLVALQAVLLLVVGARLFLAPAHAASWWPWPLTAAHRSGRRRVGVQPRGGRGPRAVGTRRPARPARGHGLRRVRGPRDDQRAALPRRRRLDLRRRRDLSRLPREQRGDRSGHVVARDEHPVRIRREHLSQGADTFANSPYSSSCIRPRSWSWPSARLTNPAHLHGSTSACPTPPRPPSSTARCSVGRPPSTPGPKPVATACSRSAA